MIGQELDKASFWRVDNGTQLRPTSSYLTCRQGSHTLLWNWWLTLLLMVWSEQRLLFLQYHFKVAKLHSKGTTVEHHTVFCAGHPKFATVGQIHMQQEKFGWTEVGGDFLTPDGKFRYLSICYKTSLLL